MRTSSSPSGCLEVNGPLIGTHQIAIWKGQDGESLPWQASLLFCRLSESQRLHPAEQTVGIPGQIDRPGAASNPDEA